MTSVINRRAALGMLGAGSTAALLAACGGGSSDSSSSSSSDAAASERSDYSGEVKLEKYDESAGTYEPATREHPAKNAPKPIKPDNANEDSVAGLYASLAYIGAVVTYAMLTGDPQPLKDTALEESEIMQIVYSGGIPPVQEKTWWSDPSFKITLDSPQPAKNGDEYSWPAKAERRIGDYTVKSGSFQEVPEDKRVRTGSVTFKAKYSGGAWSIKANYQG